LNIRKVVLLKNEAEYSRSMVLTKKQSISEDWVKKTETSWLFVKSASHTPSGVLVKSSVLKNW